MYQIVEHQSAAWVAFPQLGVPHACSTRRGGESAGPYASLNLGRMSGDALEIVEANRLRFAAWMGFPIRQNLQMDHGVKVAHIVNPDEWQRSWSADACITAHPRVSLSLTTADCVPIFFVDPVRPAVGLAHAGWRGTVGGIAARTVEAMVEHLGCRVSDLRVAQGPAIAACCFEVGEEVFLAFESEFGEEPGFCDWAQARPDSGKWHIDLHQANRVWLQRVGLAPSQLLDCDLCTSCRPDLFYSYRRDGGKTGRLLSAIALEKFA